LNFATIACSDDIALTKRPPSNTIDKLAINLAHDPPRVTAGCSSLRFGDA
jgi:hypothetical protein